MKKTTILFRLFALVASLSCALGASAYDFESNGLYYNITGTRTVEVTTSGSATYTGNVTIPSMVSNAGTVYQVTGIGTSAFYECSGLTSVTIPNSVTIIGNYAFQYCFGLSSITIPNSVTSIGEYAFYNSGLGNVVIGSGVINIGVKAFAGLYLEYVVCLTTTPPTISSNTFEPLVSVGPNPDFTPTNPFYIPKGCKGAYEAADYWKDYRLFEFPYDFEVNGIYYTITGDRTVEVAWNPLKYSGDITIPTMTSYNGTVYQVTAIGDKVFYQCSGLTSVTIPGSVTSIPDEAFYQCSGLTSVTIGNGVTSIGSLAFFECSGLTSVTIPNSVISIGNYAFCVCTALTSVTIPNSITTIGEGAFYCCSNLTSLTIPNSVATIGYGAFAGCSGLTSITVASGNPVYDSRNNCNAIIETASNTLIAGCKNTVIPNTVTGIRNYAFYDCTGLTSVTIPNSVTTIGNATFQGCTGLTSVICLATTPPTIESTTFDTDTYSNATLYVPAASKDAYQAADGWKNFTNIRAVPYDFMVNGICYKITGTNTVEVCENPAPYSGNVYIPSTVTYDGKTYQVTGIRTYAFYDCDGLTGVTIPNSVTTIGDAAFSGCDNLTTVTIPNSVTRIGWYAFAYCNGLTSVTIGSGVTTIDDNAFAACPALTSVTCLATTPPTLGGDVFYSDTYENATLKVPAASLNAYKTANGWRNFLRVMGIGQKGDINGDGSINVADVTALIQFILTSTPVDLSIADMDDSGTINVADVTALIRLILNS